MNIIVLVKLVPDLVEELKIDERGLELDPDWLRLKINEFDEHALEQAILLKERGLGPVTVIAPQADCVEEVLFTAAARGADRLIKLAGDIREGLNNHALARALAPVLQELQPDLVLTGVQAHNDLDGPLGPLLAGYLGFPFIGYVSGVTVGDHRATIRKEFPGGLIAELEVTLPAVLGIQTSEQPLRYVAFSKIRQAMKEAQIEEVPLFNIDSSGGPAVERMYQPEYVQRAVMISGDANETANKFVEILTGLGVI
jgi:electron transfer flavoprotein beta subunit